MEGTLSTAPTVEDLPFLCSSEGSTPCVGLSPAKPQARNSGGLLGMVGSGPSTSRLILKHDFSTLLTGDLRTFY